MSIYLIHLILINKINYIDNSINLHFTYSNSMMPGLTNLQLQIMIIAIQEVGPAVDVVGRYFGVDYLHESCGSIDFSSNSSLFHGSIRYNFVAIGDVRIFSNNRYLRRVGCVRGLPRKCKGTREYVRKPPSLPLARETAGVRECGAT